MKNSWMAVILIIGFTVCAQSQLVPQDAIKGMARGINIGNTMESPGEGDWGNPPVQEKAFDDYKNAGFTVIRIPITWDGHTSTASPYTIDAAWMNHVEQVVDWGLQRGLFIIINTHHESWIKNSYTPANEARFDSIWSQIATRLKDKSDSLLFEMINEPNPMALKNVNDLNTRILKIIRATNPTRIVSFSGNSYANSAELLAVAIPDSADKYLMGYYHSYDPYPFGLNGPGTYGSTTDINGTKAKFDQVATWSIRNGIPVTLGEFGFQKACEYNSRMCAYATVVDQGLRHGIPTFAWDDGGNFPIYNRATGSFNEIKDVLIHTYKESPNTMKISAYADSSIKIQWNNRTTENDSITVERKIDNSTFEFLAKISPQASDFIDSTTSRGKAFYYRLKASLKDSIEIQSYPVMLRISSLSRVPFSGTPISIPGKIEAENYDIGGEGLTFHDSDNINQGGSNYRPADGVDIEELPPGNIHIGYTAAGEWLEYTINVVQSGTYTITASVSSGVTSSGKFNLKFGDGTTSTFTTASTGSWSSYTNLTNTVTLQGGEQIMRFNVLTAGFNLDYLTFSQVPTAVSDIAPARFQLFDNYPNPFNPSTAFSFSIPSRSFVTLKVYDMIGREVATIVSEVFNEGRYTRQWNAQGMSSGVYYYRIQAGYFTETKKLVILK
jgi:hypothetical protein